MALGIPHVIDTPNRFLSQHVFLRSSDTLSRIKTEVHTRYTDSTSAPIGCELLVLQHRFPHTILRKQAWQSTLNAAAGRRASHRSMAVHRYHEHHTSPTIFKERHTTKSPPPTTTYFITLHCHPSHACQAYHHGLAGSLYYSTQRFMYTFREGKTRLLYLLLRAGKRGVLRREWAKSMDCWLRRPLSDGAWSMTSEGVSGQGDCM